MTSPKAPGGKQAVTVFVSAAGGLRWHSARMKRDWIKRRLDELHKTQAGLARHLGLAPPRISEMIRGTRDIQSDEWVPLASYLELRVEELLALSAGQSFVNQRPRTIRVGGFVQAGAWVETNDLPESEVFDITMPPYAPAGRKVYGLLVRGPSMNLVYPEGSIVFCVPAHDLPETRGFQSGDHVVVERLSVDLPDMMEATLKEYRVAEDGSQWLVPKSSDPRFQSPIELTPTAERFDDGGAEPLRIIGLVVGSFNPRPI